MIVEYRFANSISFLIENDKDNYILKSLEKNINFYYSQYYKLSLIEYFNFLNLNVDIVNSLKYENQILNISHFFNLYTDTKKTDKINESIIIAQNILKLNEIFSEIDLKISKNSDLIHIPSYPLYYITPNVDDKIIKGSIDFRTKGRIPTLSNLLLDFNNKLIFVWRSSQPTVL